MAPFAAQRQSNNAAAMPASLASALTQFDSPHNGLPMCWHASSDPPTSSNSAKLLQQPFERHRKRPFQRRQCQHQTQQTHAQRDGEADGEDVDLRGNA
jgi:hypothetical protein